MILTDCSYLLVCFSQMATGSYSSLLNSEGEMKKDFRESLDKLYSDSFKIDALSTGKNIPK